MGVRLNNGTVHLKAPRGSTERERSEFARLVRQGFDGSDDGLCGRIHDARCLAFYYATDDTLAAVAALKSPNESHRRSVFTQADVPINRDEYRVELGWVFVVPAHRGNGAAQSVCRLLLETAPEAGLFATTRPTNTPMIRILLALGFVRVGKPYPRRNEELVLFVRS